MPLLTAALAERMARAHMHRRAALQVGKPEIDAPVAAIGGAEQREQRLVLIDRQQLSITECPPLGWETKRHDSDFREKRLGHVPPLVSPAQTLAGDTKRN